MPGKSLNEQANGQLHGGHLVLPCLAVVIQAVHQHVAVQGIDKGAHHEPHIPLPDLSFFLHGAHVVTQEGMKLPRGAQKIISVRIHGVQRAQVGPEGVPFGLRRLEVQARSQFQVMRQVPRFPVLEFPFQFAGIFPVPDDFIQQGLFGGKVAEDGLFTNTCLLYTSPSPRD